MPCQLVGDVGQGDRRRLLAGGDHDQPAVAVETPACAEQPEQRRGATTKHGIGARISRNGQRRVARRAQHAAYRRHVLGRGVRRRMTRPKMSVARLRMRGSRRKGAPRGRVAMCSRAIAAIESSSRSRSAAPIPLAARRAPHRPHRTASAGRRAGARTAARRPLGRCASRVRPRPGRRRTRSGRAPGA